MNDALVNINGEGIQAIEMLMLLTLVSLLPSILMLMSSFTRIVIVLSFLRQAMGLQQTPPNTIIIGISLFLTLFIMAPVVEDINENAYQPYTEQTITQDEAIERATVPLKEFMLKQTKNDSIQTFLDLSGTEMTENVEDLPMTVVIPSFVMSELNRAFTMGFLIFIPFLLLDIIVASTLMSMGMVMLPPAMISMPFKLLLFLAVGGWELIITTITRSFNA